VGKPVIEVDARSGYPLWADTYDGDANPLLALEERLARPLLRFKASDRVLDACAGTGRWARFACLNGARVVATDFCAAMLEKATSPGMFALQSVQADVTHLPFRTGSFDIAVCSFGLSYVERVEDALRELARVARRVFVSDLHPAAATHGWDRSFETGAARYKFTCFQHTLSDIDSLARSCGLREEHSLEAPFGGPERHVFERAGRPDLFDRAVGIPAVYIRTWSTE